MSGAELELVVLTVGALVLAWQRVQINARMEEKRLMSESDSAMLKEQMKATQIAIAKVAQITKRLAERAGLRDANPPMEAPPAA